MKLCRRVEQKSEIWKKRYSCRAGIEGTLSQGIRGFGLRRCRYVGHAKTHLQHLFTAAAINLARLDAWLQGVTTRDGGDSEPLTFAPVNFWAGALLLAVAIDLAGVHARN